MAKEFIYGKIVRILDDQRLIIDLGLIDGVNQGDQFLIYEEGDEIASPDTGDSLGSLQLVKATMEAVVVQEKMTLLMPLLRDRPKSTVLSATLAQTRSDGTYGTDMDRERLNVRGSQVTGIKQINPIGIGDAVRSTVANEK